MIFDQNFVFFPEKKNISAQNPKFSDFWNCMVPYLHEIASNDQNFFPRHSPTSKVDPKKFLSPYEFHRWLHKFFPEKKNVSDQVAATLENRLKFHFSQKIFFEKLPKIMNKFFWSKISKNFVFLIFLSECFGEHQKWFWGIIGRQKVVFSLETWKQNFNDFGLMP